MQVAVQLSADAAYALQKNGAPNADAQALIQAVKTFGLALTPMHPGADDPNLQRYFIIDVQDRGTAQRITDHLRQLKAINAVYVKPPDELA